MANTAINLLPEQAIEALHHDKLYKQRLYYLLAIGFSLILTTLFLITLYVVSVNAVKGQENLITYQNARLDNMNSLWNEIIRLNQNTTLFPGVQENIQQIRNTLLAVNSGLDTVILSSFINQEKGVYRLDMQATNKEDSKRFTQYLETALSGAEVQQIDRITETEEEVFFTITIKYQ